MIKPQLFVDTTEDLESDIKDFQASLQTALKYASTPTDKIKQRNKLHTDDLLLDLIHHKRKFLRLYRQYGSPCYKTLYNQYTTRVKDRLRVLRNESWDGTLSQCNIDKVPPWQMLHRIKNSGAPKRPTALYDQHCYVYHPLDKARVLASTVEDRFAPHHLATPDHEL